MKTKIFYYSYSGVTRELALTLKAKLSSGTSDLVDVVEIKPKKAYNSLTAYSVGVKRARYGDCDPIEEVNADVSDCDVFLIGMPVWAARPAPPINTLIKDISGGEGKTAVIFSTMKKSGGIETLDAAEKLLSEKGVKVAGKFALTEKESVIDEKIEEIAAAARTAVHQSA